MLRDAATADVGRTCPYCRFPLKAHVQVAECDACATTHHVDCWEDNGGCAVVGCGAEATSSRTALAPAPTPTVVMPPPPAPAAPVAAASSPGRTRWLLPAAMITLALAIGGSVAAVGSMDDGQTAVTAAVSTEVVNQTETAPPPTEEPAPEVAEAPRETTAAPPPPDREEAITDLIRKYYSSVRAGDYDTAWSLLSPSYKTWKAGNGGRAKWTQQEDMNRRHLLGAAADVQVLSYDPATKIATLMVTGMTYQEPGIGQCPYEGVTWARRYGDAWRYDQGYLQRRQRAAKWRPRASETLGYLCQDGY